MANLALLGGPRTRTKPFSNRPCVDEWERRYVGECLDENAFSRFIGSPVGDFRKYLGLTSSEAVELADFWSVLGGPKVRRFEAEFAKRHGVKYAVSSNSATSSITSAVIACGVKAGDEVVTTPLSFTATATATKIAGANVVFADIDPETFCVTAKTIEARLTPRTKAVVLVHFVGNAGDVVAIRDLCRARGIALIEDSAQALHTTKDGRYLGTFGSVGIFSFQETKNIMTGEGGMAVTDDPAIAYKLRLIRNHGEAMVFDGVDSRDVIDAGVGYNFRLPEILAAVGLAQLRKLDDLDHMRRENFRYLQKGLASFGFLRLVRFTNDPDALVPHAAAMSFQHAKIHRNTFAEALRAEGIPVSTGYPRLLNENPYTKEDLSLTPTAKTINEERYLSLFQIGYPNTVDDMRDVVAAIDKIARNVDELAGIDLNYVKKREYNSGRL